MRIVLLFFTALFALPLAAQEIGAAQQLRKLMQGYRYLDGLYVDEVEMGPLVESAIEGMLEELDPHSAYIGAEDMKGVQESFDGEFSGIGIEFNVLRDTVIVVNTIVGGPAERVGVMPNDRIVRIDTLDAVGFKQTDVPKHLRGKTGTRVEIDVVRHGEPAPLHFVTRFLSTRSMRPIWPPTAWAISRSIVSDARRCRSSARRSTSWAGPKA